MAINTDVLILGGGLAGLSTAYHLNQLKGISSLVVEKKSTVGGLAGSVTRQGFTFDYTGHLLHLHDQYGMALILDLLKGNLAVHERSSWIFSKGAFTRYPFQANTRGLPERVVDECLLGFLQTVHWPKALRPNPSFKDWSLATFGAGISRHFMLPYNEKLWRTPLAQLTTEWQGRFVPKPKPGEVLYGALFDQDKSFGYNATFRYPERGGIQVLPDALAARLAPGQVRLNSPVLRVDLKARCAEVSGVGSLRFERLVNTLPLPHFIDLCSPWSAPVLAARHKLNYNTVHNLNIGVDRVNISKKHWIYFPEKKYPFYRAGFSSNFSKTTVPPGTSSLYIEVARKPWEKVDYPSLENSVIGGLRSSGLLKNSDKVTARVWLPIECAYVVYDFNRTPAVETLFANFKKAGIESIGRYGGWKYSFMEETILDGKRCAERLGGKAVEEARVSQTELAPLK